MARIGLISNHVVLTVSSDEEIFITPQRAVVLIENELIFEVVLLSPNEGIEELNKRFEDWKLVDYSEYYISPGIIDLNVRTEWESVGDLTKQSVVGGVTLLAVEPGYYKKIEDSKPLACDVIPIQVINESSHIDNSCHNALYKVYLFPPAPHVKSIANLRHVIEKVGKRDKPLFIDATLPDPRMLYMASPLRLEEVENREEVTNINFSSFASAFPTDNKDSSDESLESSEDSPVRKRSMNESNTALLESKSQKIPRDLRSEPSPVKKGKTLTIDSAVYQDLDSRIQSIHHQHEDLFIAETSTYDNSGCTNYTQKKTASLSLLDFNQEFSALKLAPPRPSLPTPNPNSFMSKFLNRVQSLNLQPLVTKVESKPSSLSDYSHHLANYPMDWETNGVKKVLEHISEDTRVHFMGLSSASAINLILQACKTHRYLTCEISAVNLSFASLNVTEGDTRFKNNPPVRNAANNTLLWDLLKVKAIDCITSGHASIIVNKKKTQNFQTALNGISSAGCTLQAVWLAINKPVSTPEQLESYIVRLAKWLSLYPAQILGLSDFRGSISKGKIADLIVWDPNEKFSLDRNYAYFDTSPFVGQDLMGKIKAVYIRGSAVGLT